MQITRICKSLIIIILKNMIIFLKKHVHVFHKSRTSFSENTYTFLPDHTTEDKNKYRKTRSHTDGFRRNNANYWNKREICRFYLYSSIIWFCPVLEELGK